MNHYLESNYGSTMVQIHTAGYSPRLTQYSWTRALSGQEFGVCSIWTQKDREEEERRDVCVLRVGMLLNSLFIEGI